MVTTDDEAIGLGAREENAQQGARAGGVTDAAHDAPARCHVVSPKLDDWSA